MCLETLVTYVSEVTDFKSEVRFDLQCCLEAVVASEVTIRATINNMHTDIKVIEVTDFKS